MNSPERLPKTPKEATNPAVTELTESRDRLIETAREVSRSQVDLWRQIPWLALHAYGKQGDFEKFEEAIREGYWTLDTAPNGLKHSVRTGVVVDLETGELIDELSTYARQDENPAPIPAHTSSILKVLAVPEQLNAQAVLDELTEYGQKPQEYELDTHGEDTEAFVREMSQQYGIDPVYTRARVKQDL